MIYKHVASRRVSPAPVSRGFFAASSSVVWLPAHQSGAAGLSWVEDAAQKFVAVLFACKNSNYNALSACDVWDISRDARNYCGDLPVIAHPPCRAWAGLRHMAKPRHDEKELALFAVDQVRRCGGVLEHPSRSQLWSAAGLPPPGVIDSFGGFTFPIFQHDFGHRAQKSTLLYICGIPPSALPPFPLRLGDAQFVIGTSGRCKDGSRKYRPSTTKAERELTPPALSRWLFYVCLAVRSHRAAALAAAGVGALSNNRYGSYVIPVQSAMGGTEC
jgi:hypothetical protein